MKNLKQKGLFWMMLKKQKKLEILLMTLAGLTACTQNISGDFCLLYEPVYADYTNDTLETIRQIDRNNVLYDELCE